MTVLNDVECFVYWFRRMTLLRLRADCRRAGNILMVPFCEQLLMFAVVHTDLFEGILSFQRNLQP